METLAPASIDELCDMIARAASSGEKLDIRGGGSKAAIGWPDRAAAILDMTGFSGILDYDPAELVITLGAGTRLSEVSKLLAEHGQELAFDPFDYAAVLDGPVEQSTIGGVVAAGVCGPRAISRGRPRDHVLGFEAVSGRAEQFQAGGKVVKNVTGYDLPKLLAGSWGRLAALTSLTLRTVPRPEFACSLGCKGLAPGKALDAQARAMTSSAGVSAAAHMPAGSLGDEAMTMLRLDGFEIGVRSRLEDLRRLLAEFGDWQPVDNASENGFWSDIRSAKPLSQSPLLWRAVLPPSSAQALAQELERHGASWFADWAGSLFWIGLDHPDIDIRAVLQPLGGHATLIRAPVSIRAHTPALTLPERGLAQLNDRVRKGFDPHGVFEAGRFMDIHNAN
ncbi:MAG: FAD-binding protein [Blastomonas sp.]